MTKDQRRLIDLSERIAALEAEVKFYKFDKLTGLKRRNDFEKDFNILFDAGQPFCLVLVDVNNLKEANNESYEVGDNLIKKCVQQLAECSPLGSRNMYRYGGDEFILLLTFTREFHTEDLNCPSDMYSIATKCSTYFKTASDLFHSVNELLLARKKVYYNSHTNNRRKTNLDS